MVPDPFMDTGDKSKACLLEPKYLIFIDWDVDCKCIVKIIPPHLHVFAEQVLNEIRRNGE